jgi:hypothetical protein
MPNRLAEQHPESGGPTKPVNTLRSDRAEVNEIAVFRGF